MGAPQLPRPAQLWQSCWTLPVIGCYLPSLLSIDSSSGELRVPHRYWVQDEDCLNLNIRTPACDAQSGRESWSGSMAADFAYHPLSRWSAIRKHGAEGGICVVGKVTLNHLLEHPGLRDFSPILGVCETPVRRG